MTLFCWVSSRPLSEEIAEVPRCEARWDRWDGSDSRDLKPFEALGAEPRRFLWRHMAVVVKTNGAVAVKTVLGSTILVGLGEFTTHFRTYFSGWIG